MKNSRSIVWGGLLVVFGLFWLLRNMNVLVVDWQEILPYWPALLIVAGALLLATGRERSGSTSGAVGLLITLAVLGGIVHRTDRAFDDHRDKWNFGWNNNDDDHYDGNHDEENEEEEHSQDERDDDYQSENRRRDGKPVNAAYKYEMEDFIQKATFNLEGGAGSFKLQGSTAKLFEANTKSTIVGFQSNTSINKLDHSATVNLKMEEGNVKIKNGEISNQANIQLNEKPVWSVDLGIGAGKGNFDFSNYKVENLKVSTGVAEMDIKMGDKMPMSNVSIEAGVASVTLDIPKSVGCEMHIDGALNARSFDGMERVAAGHYQSPNFSSAAKKIVINFEGGLTSININRY